MYMAYWFVIIYQKHFVWLISSNCILSSILRTFFIENDAEVLSAYYTWLVAFTNIIYKQSIQVKLSNEGAHYTHMCTIIDQIG
jgi:hypothetical protein